MSDIFKLFDGSLSGGGPSLSGQTADSFSDVDEENDLISKIASGSDSVELLVDYSDFSNFVWLNSAESYVNITADKIINEYPIDGSAVNVYSFTSALDGYQKYFLEQWPVASCHLRLNPANGWQYIRFDDIGVVDGVTRSSMMSPGTGSVSVQAWIDVPVMTGSEDAQVIFEKKRVGSSDGYCLFTSGSKVFGLIRSGSSETVVSASLTEFPAFVCVSCDRSDATGSLKIFTATTGTFPVIRDSSGLALMGALDLASGSFYIGSGSLITKTVRPFTGSIDDVSVWSTARSLADLTSSFNRKIQAQSGLLSAWRFNDATSGTLSPGAALVRDGSGHRLDGRIQSYTSAARGSGSLSFGSPDPILTFDDPNLIHYLVGAQVTGALYDRNNEGLIFRRFPEAFSVQEKQSSEVFQNFGLILGRFFDKIKLYISQLTNMQNVSYEDFDQAPDELLVDLGRFMGWDLDGNFATVDALKYFLGRDIVAGPETNLEFDDKLNDIKSEFWRRTLLNLLYIYKTKGTRESVESLLRVYGANNGFVRLKEYSRKNHSRLELNHVEAEKSFGTARFALTSAIVEKPVTVSDNISLEMRARFPLLTDARLTPTQVSGTIITLSSGSHPLWVGYAKDSISSKTGTIFLSSSAGYIGIPSLPIFDNRFYNMSVVRETATGSLTLRVMRYESGEESFVTSSAVTSNSALFPSIIPYSRVIVGGGQFYGHEARVWSAALKESELVEHAKNFESFGRETALQTDSLLTHMRMGETQNEATGSFQVFDSVSGFGLATGFVAPSIVKSLDSYAYIPSIEYGWNQQKIRVYEGSTVPWSERYTDERFVSLEFNMYDALNEDISHVMSSYDEMSSAIGLPVNRYREDYEGLAGMRETYFKRLQGKLNFGVFADMLEFFDTSFVSLISRLLPARTIFNGDEMVIESHMLERPKFQYQLRPVVEGLIDISGSISVIDRDEDWA